MNVYVRIEEVANAIGLSPSTVKKYYLMIEDQGYRFKRNNQGQLIFSNEDIEMFQRIIILKNEPGMSVQKAVEKVVTSITAMTVYKEREDNQEVDQAVKELLEVLDKKFDSHLSKVTEILLKQQDEIKALKEEQQSSKLLLEENIEDRDKKLMESIRLLQDVKEELATAKSKKWWEFWK